MDRISVDFVFDEWQAMNYVRSYFIRCARLFGANRIGTGSEIRSYQDARIEEALNYNNKMEFIKKEKRAT